MNNETRCFIRESKWYENTIYNIAARRIKSIKDIERISKALFEDLEASLSALIMFLSRSLLNWDISGRLEAYKMRGLTS